MAEILAMSHHRATKGADDTLLVYFNEPEPWSRLDNSSAASPTLQR